MKYTLEYCRKNKVAIEIKSDREYFDVIKITGTNPIDNYSSTVRDKGDYQRIAIQVNDLWCSVKWYKDKGYEVITAQQFLDDNRVMKYKIGDKVVPIGKSVTTGLELSNAWKKGKAQGFMYVTRVDTDKYVCWHTLPSYEGDHFAESDLIPYEEPFVLPEKWIIRTTKETYDIVNNWFETNKYLFCNGYKDYEAWGYRNDKIGVVRYSEKNPEGYTEITFEQFKTYVLNQTKMNKKIIGYICPQDLFDGEVPKGTIYEMNAAKTSYVRKNEGYYNLPKEIVESWEPVYAQEKIVSVGGKFDVKIKDGKIWHKNDDITSFVTDMMSYFKSRNFGNNYIAVIEDVTFSKTGCQNHTTTLKEWITVWDIYNELNNG